MVQWWILGAEGMCSVLTCSAAEKCQPLGRRKDVLTTWGNSATEFMSTFLFETFWVCGFLGREGCWFYILSFYILPCFNCSSFPVCWAMVPFLGLLMQHIPMAAETSSTLERFLVLHTDRARMLQLLSWQPVINVKFNSTNFHLPCELSPPARERSDCSAVGCSLCCCPHAGVTFLSSILPAVPFALCPWRLLCEGEIKQSPWREKAEQRKGSFGEDCRSYVRSNQSLVETAKKNVTLQEQTWFCWGKVHGWFSLLPSHLHGCLQTLSALKLMRCQTLSSEENEDQEEVAGRWPGRVPDHSCEPGQHQDKAAPTLASQGAPWHDRSTFLVLYCCFPLSLPLSAYLSWKTKVWF